ncbi:PDZ domain-containing protein [Aquisphaera insulae]|uniref:PDZ domain-containing protein n=1 Tax=Aquisphaera insulae TaxID=2712864 RepID=UPI0013EDF6E6|nr:PDZ domain-containing protein [Aquisphaera insulae]
MRETTGGLLTRLALGATIALAMATTARSQQVQTKEGASIVVEGAVREVFRSSRQSRVDYIVLLEVARAEYGRNPADKRRVLAPAPGDQVYVHLYQTIGNQGGGYNAIPEERSTIRAYLYPRSEAGWVGAFPDWYDQVGPATAGRGQNDPEPPAPTTAPVPTPSPAPAPTTTTTADPTKGGILQQLGIRAEQVKVSGRLVLKILDVLPESPAGRAGFEKGDAIIGVNGGFITDLDHLASAIAKGGDTATLTALNVRNGQTTPVKVDVSEIIAANAAAPKAEPSPEPTPSAPARKTLGVKTQQVRAGIFATALRVTEVAEGSPAAKAGIEPGDVIVSADGEKTPDSAHLEAAVQKSGPVLTLNVLDTRTRREVPVKVELEATAAAPQPAPAPTGNPAPQPAPAGGGTSLRSVGLVVEAGTADLLPVVKVVQVVPGSPAEKSGIEPGDSIVGVNDKVVFAPDLLDQALRSVGNSFVLNVMDVKTGKKTPVKVNIP